MALNFNPYPQRPDERRERLQMLLQGIGGITQGLGQYQQRQQAGLQQQQLLDLQKAKEEREKREFNFKHGEAIDSNISIGVPNNIVGGQSSFMPRGQGPIGTGMPMVDDFHKWNMSGRPMSSSRPEYVAALPHEERTRLFEQNSPKYQMDLKKDEADLQYKLAQAEWLKRKPADGGSGSFMFAGTNGEGAPIFYNNKTLEPRAATVPGGGQIYPKIPTDGQQNASLFGQRANEANEQLKTLTMKGFNPASIGSGLQGKLPNIMQPAEVQQFKQAKLNFIAAVLRKESGAAISPSEEKWADEQYFEKTGDMPETIRQKEINRASAISGLNRIAGPLAVNPQGGGRDAGQSQAPQFESLAEAEAANLPVGTRIMVGGRPATVR